MSTIRAARSTLADGWLPFLESLLTCGVLDGYVPAHLDGTDLRESTMLAAQDNGWLVLTDPLSIGMSPLEMTEADARALAKVPADRFATAHELKAALAAAAAEQATLPTTGGVRRTGASTSAVISIG